tara:strand:- start:3560 stop:3694 length:135 start_codon:yes stop_codon:yes gene_type:complete
MIKTVVREHHWTPDFIDELFVDDTDWHGIEYWWEDVRESLKKKS